MKPFRRQRQYGAGLSLGVAMATRARALWQLPYTIFGRKLYWYLAVHHCASFIQKMAAALAPGRSSAIKGTTRINVRHCSISGCSLRSRLIGDHRECVFWQAASYSICFVGWTGVFSRIAPSQMNKNQSTYLRHFLYRRLSTAWFFCRGFLRLGAPLTEPNTRLSFHIRNRCCIVPEDSPIPCDLCWGYGTDARSFIGCVIHQSDTPIQCTHPVHPSFHGGCRCTASSIPLLRQFSSYQPLWWVLKIT